MSAFMLFVEPEVEGQLLLAASKIVGLGISGWPSEIRKGGKKTAIYMGGDIAATSFLVDVDFDVMVSRLFEAVSE